MGCQDTDLVTEVLLATDEKRPNGRKHTAADKGPEKSKGRGKTTKESVKPAIEIEEHAICLQKDEKRNDSA